LKLSRDALEENAPRDQEPLGIDLDAWDMLPLELVWNALHTGASQLPPKAPPHIARSGRHASGELGELAWKGLVADAQPYLDTARALPLFANGARKPESLAVDLHLDGVRLIGTLGNIYRDNEGLWLVSITKSAVSFKQLLPLFLQWAALKLSVAEDQPCQLSMVYKNGKKGPALGPPVAFTQDPELLREGLRVLLGMYQTAERTAGVYYAKTSYAFAETERTSDPGAENPKSPLSEARKAWESDEGAGKKGERDYLPLYNLMLAGNESFLDSDAFAITAKTLMRTITGQLNQAEGA
jgi:exonuclease V gamma subunit